jgi:hypothetical protein
MADYEPKPVNTLKVRLDSGLQKLTELLARNAHEVWAARRMQEGWRFGPVRDDKKKEHPCLVAYEDLPESEKEYDRSAAVETLKVIVSLGYRMVSPLK